MAALLVGHVFYNNKSELTNKTIIIHIITILKLRMIMSKIIPKAYLFKTSFIKYAVVISRQQNESANFHAFSFIL